MKNKPQLMLSLAVALLAGTWTPGYALDQLDAPETVTIGGLSNLYQPVVFSHKHHSKLARCKDCHHHTTGQQDMDPNCIRCHAQSKETSVVSCSACHSKKQFYPEQVAAGNNPNIYHIDKPGIKGAYHLNCIPCHTEKNGPTGCQDCHAMTEKGRAFFSIGATSASDDKAKKPAEQHTR